MRASPRELLSCAFMTSIPSGLEAAVSREAARVRQLRSEGGLKQRLAESVSALSMTLMTLGCDIKSAAASLGILQVRSLLTFRDTRPARLIQGGRGQPGARLRCQAS